MTTNRKVYLTKEQAKDCLLVENGRVHTLQAFTGMGMMGADMSEADVYLLFEFRRVEIAGDNARDLKHGIVVLDQNGTPTFLRTHEDKLQKYDPKN